MDKLHRQIAVLLFDGVNILDLAGPLQAFKLATIANKRAYGLRFVSVDGQPVRTCCGLELIPDARAELSQAHTKTPRDLLVPGGASVAAALTDTALRALIEGWSQQHPKGHVTTIRSGALLLANAGVLGGKPATTHWSREREIIHHFPKVIWDLDRIYILQEGLATSAGVTAGIDMALSPIRADCGGACALQVALELVMSQHRSGGQRQFAPTLKGQFTTQGALDALIEALFETADKPWTLDAMARFANQTPRSLSRHFKRGTGMYPIKFLKHVRVKLTCDRLLSGKPTPIHPPL